MVNTWCVIKEMDFTDVTQGMRLGGKEKMVQ